MRGDAQSPTTAPKANPTSRCTEEDPKHRGVNSSRMVGAIAQQSQSTRVRLPCRAAGPMNAHHVCQHQRAIDKLLLPQRPAADALSPLPFESYLLNLANPSGSATAGARCYRTRRFTFPSLGGLVGGSWPGLSPPDLRFTLEWGERRKCLRTGANRNAGE